MPATQTVPPVHPFPPHCPHFATVPLAVVVAFAVEVVLVVTSVVAEAVVGIAVALPPSAETTE